MAVSRTEETTQALHMESSTSCARSSQGGFSKTPSEKSRLQNLVKVSCDGSLCLNKTTHDCEDPTKKVAVPEDDRANDSDCLMIEEAVTDVEDMQ